MSVPPPLPPRVSPRLVKGLGWVFILLGLLLSVSMAFITRYMIGVVNAPKVPGSLPSWSGSHDLTVHMFWMFGGVFLFGLLALANGVWAVRRGALQPALRLLLVGLGGALFLAAVIVDRLDG